MTATKKAKRDFTDGPLFFRILWVLFIFPIKTMNTLTGLFMIFPLSWGATAILLAAVAVFAYFKFKSSQVHLQCNDC